MGFAHISQPFSEEVRSLSSFFWHFIHPDALFFAAFLLCSALDKSFEFFIFSYAVWLFPSPTHAMYYFLSFFIVFHFNIPEIPAVSYPPSQNLMRTADRYWLKKKR